MTRKTCAGNSDAHQVSGIDSSESNSSDIQQIAVDLTKFQVHALAALAEKDRYGTAIKEELEEYYQKEVNHGRLYPNLDTLVDNDLVEKSQRDRRTNNYSLTEKGEAVLEFEVGWLYDQIKGGDGQ